jgi:hypothetical protein
LEFALWIRAFGDRVRSGRTSNTFTLVVLSLAMLRFPFRSILECKISSHLFLHTPAASLTCNPFLDTKLASKSRPIQNLVLESEVLKKKITCIRVLLMNKEAYYLQVYIDKYHM